VAHFSRLVPGAPGSRAGFGPGAWVPLLARSFTIWSCRSPSGPSGPRLASRRGRGSVSKKSLPRVT